MISRGITALATAALLAAAVPPCALAQSSGTVAPPQASSTAPTQQQKPGGTVLFERHAPAPEDEVAPESVASPPPPAAPPQPTLKRRTPVSAQPSAPPAPQQGASAAKVPEHLRTDLRVTSTDLDLHLDQHTAELTAHARLRVRNAGSEPASEIVLQVSSALPWSEVRVTGSASAVSAFEHHRLLTDLDHTGAADEAVLPLAQPLAPGASVEIDAFYGGTLHASAERLLRLGAPPDQASAADWDTISDTFTGLRGLGNVLWYPAIAPPEFLGSGEAFTRAVDANRAVSAKATFRLRLTLLYRGERPDAAFFCGVRMPLEGFRGGSTAAQSQQTAASSSSSSSALDDGVPADANAGADDEGVAVTEWPTAPLSFHTPSLFVAQGGPQEEAAHLLRAVTDHADTAGVFGDALMQEKPVVSEWLGASPRRPLDVLDLPVTDGSPFEDGSLLVTPMRSVDPASLAPAMAYALPSLWLPQMGSQPGAPPWITEGLAQFARALYVESTAGRDAALAELAAGGDQLAELETFSHPGVISSPPEKSASPDTVSDPIPGVLAPRSTAAKTSPEETETGGAVPLSRCVDAACARTKAAYVFEMLRFLVGDAALKQALSATLEDAARVANQGGAGGGPASMTADFERLVTASSGKDLQWFFRDWIDTDPGLPELQIVTVAPRRVESAATPDVLPGRKAYGGPIGPLPVPQKDPNREGGASTPAGTSPSDPVPPAPGSWLVAVEVRNLGAAEVEVPVTVRSGSLINTLPLRVPAHGVATVRVPFEAEPREVLVNDGTVPEVRASTHRLTIRDVGE